MKNYVIGYVLSILLTLGAAGLIFIHDWSGHTIFTHPFLRAAVVVLAVVQILVQLLFFLHLGERGRGSRHRLAFFAFTLIVLFILVGGSLWIMANLNYNMTSRSPVDVMQYMQDEQ